MNNASDLTTIGRAVDVGIITIVPTEVEALFDTLAISRERYEPVESPLRYWRASYRSTYSRRSLSIVVSILGGEAGNTEAAIATAHFLRDWYPKLMCLVGLAAGIEGKMRIGDVVIPNKVHDRTIKVFENGRYRIRGRTDTRNDTLDRMLKVSPLSSNDCLAALRVATNEDISRAMTVAREKSLSTEQFNGELRIMDGSIASDNILIRDPTYFHSILDSTDEKCRGGEMEAAGFVLACQRERTDFPWLVVRGISDFGDSKKDDSFQLLAAKAACATLRLFIEKTLMIEALPPNPRALRSESTLEFNLVRQVREAFSAKRWKEVCRLGGALSRPLWLSGHAALRYEIGRLVEDAAAFSNDRAARAAALIDDLGWTAIKLGQGAQGEKHIQDGIRLATECADHYLVAKGYRHLASLQRQTGDLEATESYLVNSKKAVERITDEEQRSEMISTLQVSVAKLQAGRGNYPKAVKLLRDALRAFLDAGDSEREVKVYAQLAHCSEMMGDTEEAQRLYVTGRAKAQEAGRFDEFAQNTRGVIALVGKNEPERGKALAREVYDYALSNGLWDEARKWQEEYHLSEMTKSAAKEGSR